MMLDECKDKIIDLYCKGNYSLVGIADIFGVNHKTVLNSLKHWGVEEDAYNKLAKVYIPKEALSNMYMSGKTQEQIAAFFNCSRGTIRRRLRKLNILKDDRNGARFRRKELPKDEVIKLYNNGFSCAEIAVKFGVSRSFVYTRLVMWGAPTRNFTDANIVRYSRGIVINGKGAYGKGGWHETPNQGKRWMRSMWEMVVAHYLSSVGIDWYYEHHCLVLEDGSKYLPDFYIPLENRYIEVKGRKTTYTLKKFLMAEKLYNIELWDLYKLIELKLVDCRGVVLKERFKDANIS